MAIILPVHIAAGSVGIIAGTIALSTLKGGMRHRRSGLVFAVAMCVMASMAVVISLWPPINPGNVLQSMLTMYLIGTAILAVRARTETSRRIEIGALGVAASIALTHLTLGIVTLNSATGHIGGYTPPMFFVFGSIALASAVGDVRVLRARELRGAARLVRHLWRMCFALFIGTGSFFLGQADEFPVWLRIWPLLTLLGLFPLIAMLYWVWRVRLRRSLRGVVTRETVSRSAAAALAAQPSLADALTRPAAASRSRAETTRVAPALHSP